ncbi:carboxymuconolactone decarboxylase family protein [Alteromonadaceae bacterium M269]|nr:carboxymuconolactone decarboxylase family protein [Alteromonadaceae bacterium M269]
MTNFTTYRIDTAPEGSKPFLESAKKAFGIEANLMGNMAEAPSLLEGYLTLNGIFGKADLSETERQIILMTNNRLNGCTYCMAAHTAISKGAGVPDDVIESLRAGTPIADPKLEALRVFAAKVNESRGWLEDGDVEALLAAGYTKQTVLEVVLGTSLKLMSNYTNHITGTQLDAAFKPTEWSAE